jgi:hypothetical protein
MQGKLSNRVILNCSRKQASNQVLTLYVIREFADARKVTGTLFQSDDEDSRFA